MGRIKPLISLIKKKKKRKKISLIRARFGSAIKFRAAIDVDQGQPQGKFGFISAQLSAPIMTNLHIIYII